jgi:hypothetical protein
MCMSMRARAIQRQLESKVLAAIVTRCAYSILISLDTIEILDLHRYTQIQNSFGKDVLASIVRQGSNLIHKQV